MIAPPQIIAGLDIGTTKICCVIAKHIGTDIEIIGMGQIPSPGVRHGQVLNIEATATAIRKAVDLAQRMAGRQISQVVVGIADRSVKSRNCTGMITLNSSEVTEQDIKRVLESAKSSISVPDYEFLHVIPREYHVDGLDEISNPLGMSCSRLEVRAHLITASTSSVRNITKACERAGIHVSSVVLQSLASADSVLSADEKEMGVALLDMGGGTTDIAVFKQGVLWHTAELTVAGSHLTADLAKHLRILPTEAEQMKLQYGNCRAEKAEKVTCGTRSLNHEKIVAIIQQRIQEIITAAAHETRQSKHGGSLVAGLVITGGTALLPDLDMFIEQLTNVPVRIGLPTGFQGFSDMVKHPACATAVGLVVRHSSESAVAPLPEQAKTNGFVKKTFTWIKEFF